MIELSVEADIKLATAYLSSVETQGVPAASARALNRAATAVKTLSAREMNKVRNLKVGVIKSTMFTRRATRQTQVATVGVTGRPISIRHFASKASQGGGTKWVTVRIGSRGKYIRLQANGFKGFINAKWRPGVFVRTRKSRGRNPKGYIKAWRPVPGLPRVFVQDHIVRAMKTEAWTVFNRRFAHEVGREIDKASRRYAHRH